MRTITLEFLRHGPAHNQLLSPLTNYLALCGDHGAETVHMPFEHNQLLHRLRSLTYKSDENAREFQLRDTAQTLSKVLGAVPGLTAEMSRHHEGRDALLHLRMIVSASELALVPFELADAPAGFPGAGQPLLLQNQLPLCLTREVRRVANSDFQWPKRPKILFIAAQPSDVGPIPLEAHVLALRQAVDPWVNVWNDDEKERTRQVQDLITVLPAASIDAIQDLCAQNDFTHIHILAHGIGYDDGEDHRYGLALHRRGLSGGHDPVSGARLATALRAARAPTGEKLGLPAVVTLACCDSGNVGSVAGAGASVAHDLHAAGIPMVVASQFPLSFAGSVLMVEILYGELVHALDPRTALNKLRRELRARIPEAHDWASIVGYAALPTNFDSQLPDMQIHRARLAINSVLQEAGRLFSEERLLAVCRKSTDRKQDNIKLDAARDLLKEDRYEKYLKKVSETKDLLASLLKTAPMKAAEIHGLLASADKRTAEILHYLQQVAPSEKAEHLSERSAGYAGCALEHYLICTRLEPADGWPLHQALSLSLALGSNADEVNSSAERETDPSVFFALGLPKDSHAEMWMHALNLSRAMLGSEDIKTQRWAHTDLIEIWLLAGDPTCWNGGEVVQTCIDLLPPPPQKAVSKRGPKPARVPPALQWALHHARELVRLSPADPFATELTDDPRFAVRTTAFQLLRYHDWLTKLKGSLLGNIGPHALTLLRELYPALTSTSCRKAS